MFFTLHTDIFPTDIICTHLHHSIQFPGTLNLFASRDLIFLTGCSSDHSEVEVVWCRFWAGVSTHVLKKELPKC